MEKLANKVFYQFEENIQELNKVSNIHKVEKDKIIDLYNTVERLKNRIVMLHDYEKQLAIFNLSANGNTRINKLLENCIMKI